MDEVKIWALDGDSNVVPLTSKGQTDTESLLEETLVRNPDLLIPGLRLVGRQTPTDGGPLDLVGVDEDGRLIVFELKRGTLSRDAVAQIIDYASDLDTKTDVALAQHIAANSGVGGIEHIEDFEEWYGENTEGQSLDSLRPLRLVLIVTYDGKTFLARQVEVEAATDPGPRRLRPYVSRAEKRERLARRVEDSDMSETFGAAEGMFKENWPRSSTNPGGHGLSITLQRLPYARIGVSKGGVTIVFFPRAKALCLDEFRQPVKEIRHDTWPKNREPVEDPDTEIQFKFTAEEWEEHKERLSALTAAVYEAWENSGQ